MSTNSKLIFFIGIFLFLLSFSLLSKALLLDYFPDFTGYYYGAKHIIERENPYQYDSSYFTAQSYPPFTLILFMPLAFFPLVIASKLWTIFSLLVILIVLSVIYKIHNKSFFSPESLFLSAIVFFFFPLKFSLGMGQINILILLFITLVIFYFHKKKYNLSGIFLAFPIMIKFFPLLVLPYFIFSKHWKVLQYFLITILLLMGITFLFLSFPTIQYYFHHILPDLFSSWKGEYYNQSLTGLIMRGVEDPLTRQVMRGLLSLVLVASLLYAFLKKRKSTREIQNLQISSVITLTLLINSFSWQHHFVWLLLPYLLTYFFIKKYSPKLIYFIVLAISYILVAINIKDPYLLPIFLQSHVFYGGVLLYGLQLILILKAKK